MVCDTKNCKEFIMQNKQKFGITENSLKTECLDICTHNVRYIASRRINERITLPSMSQFINSCTGLIDTAGGIDTKFASLRITHAKEELVNCDTQNPGVQVTIKGQVIVRTKSANSNCPPSYMAIPVELVSEVIYDYYSTENGERVNCLANVLPMVDGSCMVINLACQIYREVCQGYSRYVAHIKGSVVDKLWKTENIWVEGIRPYTAPSITVCDVFEKDIGEACGDYIRMETRPMSDDGDGYNGYNGNQTNWNENRYDYYGRNRNDDRCGCSDGCGNKNDDGCGRNRNDDRCGCSDSCGNKHNDDCGRNRNDDRDGKHNDDCGNKHNDDCGRNRNDNCSGCQSNRTGCGCD